MLSHLHQTSLKLRLFLLCLGLVCLFTLTGFFGDTHWVLDLTTHFRVQYLIILVLGLFALLKLPKALRMGCMLPILVCIGLNWLEVSPYLFPQFHANASIVQDLEASDTRLKILHINVFKHNNNYEQVVRLIQEKDPDILSLQEVSPEWLHELNQSGILGRFPYTAFHPFSESGLYSRIPVHKMEVHQVQGSPDPRYSEPGENSILVARLQLHGQPVTILSLHPAPFSESSLQQPQAEYINTLASRRAEYGNNVILLGDLNTSPWSVHFKRYLTELDLRDSRLGFGLHPSWPTFFPLAFIPIDHCLVSKNWIPLKWETGPLIGSDHLPLYLELALKKS